jgi:POT family proton-dependent oligopeptide transporter
VGLSAVTKLAVPSVAGVMLGSWFLATAYSEHMAAQLAKLAALPSVDGTPLPVAEALQAYAGLFSSLFWTGLAVGAVLLIASPLLRRMMHGIH